MRNILLCCLIASFFSCKRNKNESKKVQLNSPITISLEEKLNKESIEEYIDDIKIVPLKSQIKLIGVDKVILHKEKYYVLDKKTSNLLVYDNQGDFIQKIGERGNGPGEFKKIKDFEIDKRNENILILSELDKSIYSYSFDGVFLNKLMLDFFVHGFVLKDEDKLMFMSGRSSISHYTLTTTNFTGDILGMNFPFPENTPIISPAYTGGLHKQGESKYFTEATSSLIYTIEDIIKPMYQFEFGKDTWNENDRYDLNRFMKHDRKQELSFLYNFYCDTKNILAFSFKNKGYFRKGYFFKSSGKYLAVPYNLKDTFLYRIIGLPIGIQGDKFITSLDYNLYESLINKKRGKIFKESYPRFYENISNQLKNASFDDNPYLLVYEIKEYI